ncbi:hypothetical protein [Neorhizobium petrolearium]|uniref:hypothetical protein n=1 Tax=Neorhizobium petrolearium TaxID=515361 RepID=UPI003F178D98
MASPWKFLTRLVSPRRRKRQENGSTDDATPELLAVAKPTETAADDGLSAADPPAAEKPVSRGQSEAASASADHSEETASGVHGTADIEDAMREATDPALSDDADTAAQHAQKPLPTGKGATQKRPRRGKTAATGETVPPSSPGVPTVSDDAIRLDEEIRLLREQLARKLQLQNAQLKKMLERFQR